MKKCLNYIKLAAVAMTALPLFTGCGTGCTGIEYNVIEDCFGSWDARYTINVEGDQTGPTPAWFYIYSDKGTAFISIQGDGFSLSVKGIDYRARLGDIYFSTATGRDT